MCLITKRKKKKKKKTSKENNLLPFTAPLSLARMAFFGWPLLLMKVLKKRQKRAKTGLNGPSVGVFVLFSLVLINVVSASEKEGPFCPKKIGVEGNPPFHRVKMKRWRCNVKKWMGLEMKNNHIPLDGHTHVDRENLHNKKEMSSILFSLCVCV